MRMLGNDYKFKDNWTNKNICIVNICIYSLIALILNLIILLACDPFDKHIVLCFVLCRY